MGNADFAIIITLNRLWAVNSQYAARHDFFRRVKDINEANYRFLRTV